MNSQDQLNDDTFFQINSVIKKLDQLKQQKTKSIHNSDVSQTTSYKTNIPSQYQSSKFTANYSAFRSNPVSNNQFYTVPNTSYQQPPQFNQYMQIQNTVPPIIPQNTINNSTNFPVRMSQTNPFETVLRQSSTNDVIMMNNNVSSNSRIVYKTAVKSSNSEEMILQRLMALQNKVAEYEKKQLNETQKFRNLQHKFEQLLQLAHQQSNQIIQLKKQNAQFQKQLKTANQVQTLYQQQLKQYKVKLVNLEKSFNILKQQMVVTNQPSVTTSPFQKRKIQVIARISSNKSPERSSSKTNSSSISSGLKNVKR